MPFRNTQKQFHNIYKSSLLKWNYRAYEDFKNVVFLCLFYKIMLRSMIITSLIIIINIQINSDIFVSCNNLYNIPNINAMVFFDAIYRFKTTFIDISSNPKRYFSNCFIRQSFIVLNSRSPSNDPLTY